MHACLANCQTWYDLIHLMRSDPSYRMLQTLQVAIISSQIAQAVRERTVSGHGRPCCGCHLLLISGVSRGLSFLEIAKELGGCRRKQSTSPPTAG